MQSLKNCLTWESCSASAHPCCQPPTGRVSTTLWLPYRVTTCSVGGTNGPASLRAAYWQAALSCAKSLSVAPALCQEYVAAGAHAASRITDSAAPTVDHFIAC